MNKIMTSVTRGAIVAGTILGAHVLAQVAAEKLIKKIENTEGK